MKTFSKALFIASLLAMTNNTYAVTEISFWHSMSDSLGKHLNEIVDGFNHSQTDYKIVASYKGSYLESMDAAIAAYRANKSPDIVQILEVGTATMIYSKGAIKPIQAMSEEVGNPIKASQFIPVIADYYSDNQGKLIAMPFNSSTPVFYYNKDLLNKAGIDTNRPPRTYQEIREAAQKLKAVGVDCAYTTAWPAWILIENFGALHNVPYASKNNGFDGLDTHVNLTQEAFVKHFTLLNEMAKEGSFTYAGSNDEANKLFASKQCAMLTASSGARVGFKKDTTLNFGVSYLPYNSEITQHPQNTVLGGAALWVFSKKSPEIYKGITAFFHYLAKPEVAAKWHQDTGYVPTTQDAFEETKDSGFYGQNPGSVISYLQLNMETTQISRGVRLGFLPQIRHFQELEMEKIFSQDETVEEGLTEMNRRTNDLLSRFEKNNR